MTKPPRPWGAGGAGNSGVLAGAARSNTPESAPNAARSFRKSYRTRRGWLAPDL